MSRVVLLLCFFCVILVFLCFNRLVSVVEQQQSPPVQQPQQHHRVRDIHWPCAATIRSNSPQLRKSHSKACKAWDHTADKRWLVDHFWFEMAQVREYSSKCLSTTVWLCQNFFVSQLDDNLHTFPKSVPFCPMAQVYRVYLTEKTKQKW